MNLEDLHAVLKGASRGEGVKFNVIKHWFKRCAIIDGKTIDERLFDHDYERLCPNREDLGLVETIQLMGMLSRDSRQPLEELMQKFKNVRQIIVEEIAESYRK